MLEHSIEMEDPKYRHLEQQLREKEDEMENLHKFNSELDSKLQKLLTEFSQFRTKAHQMLSSKEEELEKLKGRSGNSSSVSMASSFSPQMTRKTSDSGYESNFETK
jgi:predicted nuclease with TOPRIM domain